MKDISPRSNESLNEMSRLIVKFLEVANSIPEKDWRKIVLASQREQRNIKGVSDNINRGNLFLVLFFVRELIQAILYSDN